MADVVRDAAAFGLALGAHPSYPDREHFGRREMAMSPVELGRAVREQVNALAEIAAAAGVGLAHVKPHGALYNTAARDLHIARVVARAVGEVDPRLRQVGLGGSQLLEAGREIGLRVAAEAFADRRYAPDGSLASRALDRALIPAMRGSRRSGGAHRSRTRSRRHRRHPTRRAGRHAVHPRRHDGAAAIVAVRDAWRVRNRRC